LLLIDDFRWKNFCAWIVAAYIVADWWGIVVFTENLVFFPLFPLFPRQYATNNANAEIYLSKSSIGESFRSRMGQFLICLRRSVNIVGNICLYLVIHSSSVAMETNVLLYHRKYLCNNQIASLAQFIDTCFYKEKKGPILFLKLVYF
jgi:hypothetical protein